MKFDAVEDARQGTVIKVVGIDAVPEGGNAVQHMINKGIKGVEFITIHTSWFIVKLLRAKGVSTGHIINIGKEGIAVAGFQSGVYRQLAEESRQRIEDALRGADMVFILASMGGYSGIEVSQIVAEVAKSLGALTVVVVPQPFDLKGKPIKLPEEHLKAMEGNADSLIVTTMDDDDVDDELINAVTSITELITSNGKMNVDFEDVAVIMRGQGRAMMGAAVASGIDRARIAAEQAVNSLLLDGVDLFGARGILVNITASTKLKGKEIREVMLTLRKFAAKDATIVQGVVYNEDMGEDIRVTVVLTGLGKKENPDSSPV